MNSISPQAYSFLSFAAEEMGSPRARTLFLEINYLPSCCE